MAKSDKYYLGIGIRLWEIFFEHNKSRPRTITPEKLPTADYLQQYFSCFSADEYAQCTSFTEQVFYMALCFCKLDEDKLKEQLKNTEKITYSIMKDLFKHHNLLIYNGLSVFFEYAYGYEFNTFRCKRDENNAKWFYKCPIGNDEYDDDVSWVDDVRDFFTKMTETDYYKDTPIRECIYNPYNSTLDHWAMSNYNYY